MNPIIATHSTARARALAWLTAWDSQGVHRTATAGDEAGALWLAAEASTLGLEVISETFSLDRLDPIASYLELDGERIPAVPVFDAPTTDADGVASCLGFGDGASGTIRCRVDASIGL